MAGRRIVVTGTVQGVGFRPHVYRLALTHTIVGKVFNASEGVIIEAFGDVIDLEKFSAACVNEAPPLALIRTSTTTPLYDTAPADFRILESSIGEKVSVDITRDTAVCNECLHELFDPNNRRYLHPFINCTNCGPRYTIIRNLPYDRPATTMADFPLCDTCAAEYRDPASRRFHAQPICCPACGPTISLLSPLGNHIATDAPIDKCKQMLADNGIVAIKGIGGFHLACCAQSLAAINRLRQFKKRIYKPFACMARDIDTVRKYCRVSSEEERLLTSPERPIVLLEIRSDSCLHPEIAPGLLVVGIMLPYAPLHYCLFDNAPFDVLIMTSANRAATPICCTDAEVLENAGAVVDALLTHDREIYIRNDDAIARVIGTEPVLLRRGRGYVPQPISADANVDGIVALGGILKSTITIGRGSVCYTSQYLGAADALETVEYGLSIKDHLCRMLDVTPSVYAADLHPADHHAQILASAGIPVVRVQHHHAHAVACIGENNLHNDVLAVVFDGMGWGSDGTIWGGEILCVNRGSYQRVGHLAYLPLPGGDQASVYPGRIAVAALNNISNVCAWMEPEERNAVISMLHDSTALLQTSSAGRYFDACAAILDVCRKRTFEGQPAMWLESIVDKTETGAYPIEVIHEGEHLVMDGIALLKEVHADFHKGTTPAVCAARFHRSMAQGVGKMVALASQAIGLRQVCLSGGCFQNAIFTQETVRILTELKYEVFIHRRLPPGDECVSFGQALVAAAHSGPAQIYFE